MSSRENQSVDVVIIGGGLVGLVFLRYAVAAGLSVRLVEREAELGGLWALLPAWQDIQSRAEDFSINGVPIAGPRQPDILANIRAWATRFRLQSHIATSFSVTGLAIASDLGIVANTVAAAVLLHRRKLV